MSLTFGAEEQLTESLIKMKEDFLDRCREILRRNKETVITKDMMIEAIRDFVITDTFKSLKMNGM
jgi:hypothetical protein